MSRAFLASFAALALALVWPQRAGAQSHCQIDVPRQDHPYAYQPRGNRCEGSCGRLTSNTTALRVVGFSRGAALPASGTPDSLALRWTSQAGAGLTLRVSAVAGPRCYRMDAEQPPGASRFTWSSRILQNVGVRPAHLAASLWTSRVVNGRSRPVVVPVEPDGPRAADEPFVVHVVPAREFDDLSFTLTRADDGAVIVASRSLGEPYYPEDVVVKVRLPPGLPAGVPLELRIVGGYAGGTNSTEVFLWIPR